MSVSIGVVGATGQVGGVMLDLLADDPGFEIENLRLFASARSAGKVLVITSRKRPNHWVCEWLVIILLSPACGAPVYLVYVC